MERYKNLNRNSGVVAYEIGPDFIKVQFSDGAIYLYHGASVNLINSRAQVRRCPAQALGGSPGGDLESAPSVE
ncbi:MAG: hypothetical protein HY348_16060 [Nitrospira defluvii]|nr:hypothetical protein [Nitrospira defluvii]